MSQPGSRRNFLRMLGLGAVAAPLGVTALGGAFAANVAGRKNFILILTDQQRDIQWFPEGWEEENLPAMTFLKQHGISFNQAVNNTCACTPSRTSIFTGTYPSKNLSNFTLSEFYQPTNATATPYNVPEDNNTNVPTAGPYPTALSYTEGQLDQTLPNLATVLADAGYDTIYKGKFHLSKGVLGYDNNSYEPDITRYGFAQWDPPDAGQDAQIQNYGGGNADNDSRFTDDAVAFLKDRVAHPGRSKKPFCLVFSLVNPHDVLGYPNNWVSTTNNGGYSPRWLHGNIDLPPTMRENLRKNFKPTSQANWLKAMGSLRGPQRKNYLNFYGNLMRHVDLQIKSLLDVLTSSPNGRRVWEETLIIRTSDHGEMGLTHGGMRQKWFNVYQETIKIPMVWSNPVMFPKPVKSDALVTLVDTLPTMASIAGIRNIGKYDLQGYDYSPLFTNPTGEVQDYTYFINTDVKAGQAIPQSAFPPNHLTMIRNARFKYAHYYGGTSLNGTTSKKVQDEFYNLATDVDPGTGQAVELENKSAWAKLQGAPWAIQPYELKKREEMKEMLAQAMKDGVLATKPRNIAPVAMKPRAKTVTNAFGAAVAATSEVYQVVCYSQHSYTYSLQILSGGAWTDVPSTTTLVATTLAGNNGPILFQAQPMLSSPPQYRVVRTNSKDVITYEDVVWENYTRA